MREFAEVGPVFDFGWTDELELLVRTARSFSEKHLLPNQRRAEAARAVDDAAREAYARTGLRELEQPVSLAGAGLGARARVLVNEELAAADAGAALALDGLGLALAPLLELAGEPGVAQLYAPLCADPGARALVVTQADGQLEWSDSTVAGHLPWVAADRLDLLIVLHETQAAVVLGPAELDGIRGAGLRAAGASSVVLRERPIALRVGDPSRVQRALARARLYVASLLLGVLRQACDYSRNYARERVAFGRPIAHHQALAFLITDMNTALSGARLLVHDAAFRADRELPCEAAAASAFVETIEASRLIGPACVQILGGHGFMQDHLVEKYMREARALGLMLGGIELAREHAGRALCDSAVPIELSALEAP